MIIINNMAHAHYIGKTLLLPGSNVVADDVKLDHRVTKALIENGSLSVETEITEAVAEKAIAEANTQATVDAIVNEVEEPSENVKKKAGKKKADLDAFDEKVKAEVEAEKKKKEEG